jgi:anti-sigma-K factor RskA
VNIKEYISSGIVESYVLGLASDEERREFEQLCTQYPELVEARTQFELALEKQAMDDAVAPPAHFKDKIWSAIRQQTTVSKTSKLITMEPTTTRRNSGSKWAVAASIILLLGASYFAYTFYTQKQDLEKANKDLQAQITERDSTIAKINGMIGGDPKGMVGKDVVVVNLVATQKKSTADIYWDSTSANVYMVVRNMPKLPNDKQYQLWAMIDGKPKDLGLFDGGNEKVILKMNNTQKADAFAITIENRGNTGGPTLDSLQSLKAMDKTKL